MVAKLIWFKLWQSTSSSLATASSFFLAGPWGFSVGVDFINEFLQLILRQFLHPLLRRAKICLRCWKHSETLWRPTILNWRPKNCLFWCRTSTTSTMQSKQQKYLWSCPKSQRNSIPVFAFTGRPIFLKAFIIVTPASFRRYPVSAWVFCLFWSLSARKPTSTALCNVLVAEIKRLSRACRIWESHAAGDKQWVLLQSKHVHFDGLLPRFLWKQDPPFAACLMARLKNVVDLQTLKLCCNLQV